MKFLFRLDIEKASKSVLHLHINCHRFRNNNPRRFKTPGAWIFYTLTKAKIKTNFVATLL